MLSIFPRIWLHYLLTYGQVPANSHMYSIWCVSLTPADLINWLIYLSCLKENFLHLSLKYAQFVL